MLPEVRTAVSELLAEPLLKSLKLLVTSIVDIDFEFADKHEIARYPLGPLSEVDAVRLFHSRSQHLYDTPQSNGTVSSIIAKLESIPLNIELIARSAAYYQISLDALLTQLRAFPEYKTPIHTAADLHAERHRSVTAAIQWSYSLVSAHHDLLRLLALFPDDFSISDASFVYSKLGAANTAFKLSWSALRAAAFVRRAEVEAGQHIERFKLLEPVRYFLLGTLTSDIHIAAATCMCEYFEARLRRQLEKLATNEAAAALAEISLDRNNILWTIQTLAKSQVTPSQESAGRLLGAFAPYLDITGPAELFFELRHNLPPLTSETTAELLVYSARAYFQTGKWEEALQASTEAKDLQSKSPIIRLAALTETGRYQALLLSAEKSETVFREALDYCDQLQQSDSSVPTSILRYFQALIHLGLARVYDRLNRSLAFESIEKAEVYATTLDSFVLIARCLNQRGLLEWHYGQLVAARAHFLKAHEMFTTINDTVWAAGALTNCGFVETDLGFFEHASNSTFPMAAELHAKVQNRSWLATNLGALGACQMWKGNHDIATKCLSDAIVELNQSGDKDAVAQFNGDLGRNYYLVATKSGKSSSSMRACELLELALDTQRRHGPPQRFLSNMVVFADALLLCGENVRAAEITAAYEEHPMIAEISSDSPVWSVRHAAEIKQRHSVRRQQRES